MKKLTQSASIVATLICTSLLAAGCGNGGAASSKTIGANGAIGLVGASAGVVTPLTNGTGQILFQGTNVFASSGFIGTTSNYGVSSAMGSDFYYPGALNTLAIGSSAVPGGGSIPATGTSTVYSGTTISMMSSPVNASGMANIGGVIFLSQSAMQELSPTGVPVTILGLALDLSGNGNSISGSAYICTRRDAGTGICHGSYIPF